MKKYHTKKVRILSLLLAALMVVMAGCGKENTASGELPVETEQGSEAEESGGDGTEDARGRYLEGDVALPEEIGRVLAMEKLDDGRIALFDGDCGLYLSEDQGQSFTYQKLSPVEEILQNEKYVAKAAIAGDGSMVVEYYEGMEGNEVKSGYLYVDQDGNGTGFTWEAPEFCFQYLFLKDGRLLGCGDGVYVIDPSGSSAEKLCDSRYTVEYMKQIGDLLYLVGGEGVEIYNLSTGNFETDTVLEDFIGDMMEKNNGSATEGAYPVLMYEGDAEDSLYIATSQGLFRHVLKGNLMEEVINGNLSSMGSAVNVLCAMVFLDKENLLICYNSSALKSYHYDPDISAVPENELVIYSLWENDAVRTAINLYQKENPDTYLSYEVGMSGSDGVTKEDAIRNLNTKLLSGNGPDILVLDGLPIKSYVEKGILGDLSALIDEKCRAKELYENIVTSYQSEQGIYAVAAWFTFPICIGKEAEGVSDLASLADRVEELRAEYPQGSITGSYREKEVLLRLYPVCSPAFVGGDGSVNKEKLRDYLTQAKRIWQAEAVNRDEEKAQTREQADEFYTNMGMGRTDWYSAASFHVNDYFSGGERILFGELGGVNFDYSQITSAFQTANEEMKVSVLNGLSQNVFIPNTVLGINAAGAHREAAEDFVMSMLETELQKQSLGTGFPVNREAMKEVLYKHDAGVSTGAVSWEDENGNQEILEIIWPTQEQIALLEQMIESLDTPASTDENVKNAVLESGVAALNGEKSVDDAVGEIMNKVQIYLAE